MRERRNSCMFYILRLIDRLPNTFSFSDCLQFDSCCARISTMIHGGRRRIGYGIGFGEICRFHCCRIICYNAAICSSAQVSSNILLSVCHSSSRRVCISCRKLYLPKLATPNIRYRRHASTISQTHSLYPNSSSIKTIILLLILTLSLRLHNLLLLHQILPIQRTRPIQPQPRPHTIQIKPMRRMARQLDHKRIFVVQELLCADGTSVRLL
jgi:hypothetical protein